ncbi:adenosine deaminase 2 [Tribolium castaneum]|uniref:Adenosine deaminase n=1 Tax=Tribolium castaneum TaxID=7070 RepID=D6WEK0_TRICA|nr:PREDICTED: adenosine deaminase CECR1 [Tribolium castaneum]EFA00425.1 Adenosine deaminase-like protein [Tribolium castaneum]|eukprot:XP_973932.1 PREDICTED: adenosine deaminase CECR1 [Tribolium castaneum]
MFPFVIFTLVTLASADYWSERAKLVTSDSSQAIGSSIILSPKEQEVNKILMNHKLKEYDDGFKNPRTFLPSIHFFKSKSGIEQSPVFDFIRKLPKGASLHSHDTALVSLDYLYNLTYRENLYGSVVKNRLQLHFFDKPPTSDWELVADLRSRNTSFDKFLKSQLSIIVDDPSSEYPSINDVWNRFAETFYTVFGLVAYRPVFQDYFYQTLKELYEDNVMYLEFRGLLPQVYELNGTVYNHVGVVQLYLETLQRFKCDYPDFHGARFIFAPSRNVDNKTVEDYVTITKELRQLFPDFVAGFDLVGQEDLGKPLVDFIPQLLELAETDTRFFFHAGETDWGGTSTDLNVFDAVLLNTTRIGHGFALVKHPKILEEVKKRQIAIEISPISNQVLKLVDDLRNHPGAFLVKSGFPVVITCDDPTFWGAKALSYDWYLAFMGFGGREGDLRLLKQLALNSLEFSAMAEDEKCDALAKWEEQWEVFLDGVVGGGKWGLSDWISVNKV